jgi:hypothetical protein
MDPQYRQNLGCKGLINIIYTYKMNDLPEYCTIAVCDQVLSDSWKKKPALIIDKVYRIPKYSKFVNTSLGVIVQ